MKKDATKIILHGCNGRMGQTIIRLARDNEEIEIVAGVDGRLSGNIYEMPTYSYIEDCNVEADVILDFTGSEGASSVLRHAVAKKLPAVICTTGLDKDVGKQLTEAASEIAVFRSANMSLGINLLAEMLSKYAKILSSAGFDIEIVEKHHNQKLDAPSGTALLLANEINNALDGELQYMYDRTKAMQKRGAKELGIHSVRGGTIMGEHSVIFAGKDEVLEFNHTAMSRDVFAVGALTAARFMKGKPAGLYTMRDIITT